VARGGVSAADLVQQVLGEVLEGKVKHDGRHPLFPLLKKVVFRHFLQVVSKARRGSTITVGSNQGIHRLLAKNPHALTHGWATLPDVPFRRTVAHAIGDDRASRDYVFAILNYGVSNSADVAFILSTTTADVENRRKRVRAILTPLRSRLKL
jgi:hypothetical protein